MRRKYNDFIKIAYSKLRENIEQYEIFEIYLYVQLRFKKPENIKH